MTHCQLSSCLQRSHPFAELVQRRPCPPPPQTWGWLGSWGQELLSKTNMGVGGREWGSRQGGVGGSPGMVAEPAKPPPSDLNQHWCDSHLEGRARHLCPRYACTTMCCLARWKQARQLRPPPPPGSILDSVEIWAGLPKKIIPGPEDGRTRVMQPNRLAAAGRPAPKEAFLHITDH